ncbi:hypothetical protein ACIQ7D_12160 [Streptomyces sp. NPDC096310]|uniref:hypothetical protein n=1 Tax=Streptomyces sp. NPDC096310 TaxID=3366082 RepID=UPI0038154838
MARMLSGQRAAQAEPAHTKPVQRAPSCGGSKPRGRTLQRAGEGEADTTTYRLQIQVRKTSRTHRAEYAGGGFGHAWVTLYTKTGNSTSYKTYGFFPTQEVTARTAFKSVGGSVRKNFDSPDDETIPGATQAPNSSDSDSDSNLQWVGASALEGNQVLELEYAPGAAPAPVPTPGRFELD